ncbi:hypothetical protein STEG23_001151, partial [Scotinomys teguina]
TALQEEVDELRSEEGQSEEEVPHNSVFAHCGVAEGDPEASRQNNGIKTVSLRFLWGKFATVHTLQQNAVKNTEAKCYGWEDVGRGALGLSHSFTHFLLRVKPSIYRKTARIIDTAIVPKPLLTMNANITTCFLVMKGRHIILEEEKIQSCVDISFRGPENLLGNDDTSRTSLEFIATSLNCSGFQIA